MNRLQWLCRMSARLPAFLVLFVLAGWPLAAQDSRGSYHERTTAVLAQLDAASRALAQGDAGGARTAISLLGPQAGDLSTRALQFRETANREFERCGDRVLELERRIGAIMTEHDRVKTEIQRLQETLASVAEQERLSTAQLDAINARMATARAALEERKRRLDELAKWWWVPGYGAYLGIRTLADHDIEDANSLANTLNDERSRLAQAGQSRAAAVRLTRELSGQIAGNEKTSDELARMHEQAVGRMSELRGTALFLTEAEAFWLKATTLLQANVAGAEQDMKLLLSLLDKELTLSEFDEEFRPTSRTMRDALLAFAASVDDGSSYLLEADTDYCGGPPRDIGGADLSERCNVSQLTRYFEIVDPVTCSFRYLNPPGCPPAAKSVDLSASSLEEGLARGTWVRSPGENWVGRASTSPCELKGSIYYGKLAGADQCESMCQGDPTCIAWSYNARNGMMPGSISQCWGASQGFNLNKGSWGGFHSGGLDQANP